MGKKKKKKKEVKDESSQDEKEKEESVEKKDEKTKKKKDVEEDEETSVSFEVGQHIEAKYGGKKWFKGTIMKINDDGTYFIQYDDGDKENVSRLSMFESL